MILRFNDKLPEIEFTGEVRVVLNSNQMPDREFDVRVPLSGLLRGK